MKRLTNKEIRNTQEVFWWAWILLVSTPASLSAWLLSEGSWWASPIAVFISVFVAYSVFDTWLKRRQRRADNTIVLCYCGHTESDHGATYDMDRACYHGEESISRACPCVNYTPRFWQMSKHT